MKSYVKTNSQFGELTEFSNTSLRRLLDLQFQSRCLVEKKIFQDLDLRRIKVLDFGSGDQGFQYRYKILNYNSLDPHFSATWKSLQEIPPNENFDLIIAVEVLEHLEDPAGVLKELVSFLRPGQKVYLTTPFLAREHGAPADYQRWTESGLKKLLIESGLQIEKMYRRGNALVAVSSILNFVVFKLIYSPGLVLGLLLLPLALFVLVLAQFSLMFNTTSSFYIGLSVLASKLPSKDL